MTIITQNDYEPDDDPPGVPLIGYNNKITFVTATSEDDSFPVTNLLNSATHLIWQAEDEGAQAVGLRTDGEANYVAVARHNLFDSGARIGLLESSNADAAAGYMQLLLHFDGTNASTNFFDSSGNDIGFVASGSASISTSQMKFGVSSIQFAGGRIQCQGFPTFDIGTADFTVDFWVRHNALGSNETYVDCGSELTGFAVAKNTSNVLIFRAAAADRITGATALAINTWYHVAVTRASGFTRLFLNGTQQGSTYTDANDYTPVALVYLGQNQGLGAPMSGFLDEFRLLIGRATWTTTFTAPTEAYADGVSGTAGNYSLLFHFDGTDASTTITDSGGAGHVFTAQGNAQLDTAQFKFGTASLLLDGTGDYLQGDGSDDFAFGTLDFTIDFWLRLNATGTDVALYDGRAAGTSTAPIVYLNKNTSNNLLLIVDGVIRITGATALSAATWYHIALSRVNGSTRLFLNGVQEGSTYTDATDYINGTNRPNIGGDGVTGGLSSLNGWIDELRVIKGIGLWTNSFAVPQRAAGDEAALGKLVDVSDGLPIIFRFTPTSDFFSLRISSGSEPAQIGVVYAGELLVLERSIKVDVQHANVNHARQSNVLSGMSESGNFLGRTLTAEWRESQAEFAWFTPDWYRTYFEPFAEAAMTTPFFWAWNPDEYPDETAFAWIIEDIRPETDPATRRVAATIVMRAIA